jgi:hypothetical protein
MGPNGSPPSTAVMVAMWGSASDAASCAWRSAATCPLNEAFELAHGASCTIAANAVGELKSDRSDPTRNGSAQR